jgi:hypothetical protein
MRMVEFTQTTRPVFINPELVASVVEVFGLDEEFRHTSIRTAAGYESVVSVKERADDVVAKLEAANERKEGNPADRGRGDTGRRVV